LTTTADNRFIFTGIHFEWTLNDGTVVRGSGRVVVQEVAPGQFEVTHASGQFDDFDPCSW
jgi:hypothetical protein